MDLKEVPETNGRIYLIYLLEKNYKDCYIKSTNDSEKKIFQKEMENLQLIENKRLMNKYFIIFQLYKTNIEDMIFTLTKKEKEDFYKLLFYSWRISYGLYDKNLDIEIDKIEKKKTYNFLIKQSINMLVDLEDEVLSIPITDDELIDNITNFDHQKFYKLLNKNK